MEYSDVIKSWSYLAHRSTNLVTYLMCILINFGALLDPVAYILLPWIRHSRFLRGCGFIELLLISILLFRCSLYTCERKNKDFCREPSYLCYFLNFFFILLLSLSTSFILKFFLCLKRVFLQQFCFYCCTSFSKQQI